MGTFGARCEVGGALCRAYISKVGIIYGIGADRVLSAGFQRRWKISPIGKVCQQDFTGVE